MFSMPKSSITTSMFPVAKVLKYKCVEFPFVDEYFQVFQRIYADDHSWRTSECGGVVAEMSALLELQLDRVRV